MTTPKTRGWFWKVHGGDYVRSGSGDIEKFIGWPTLMRLVEECANTRYKVSPVWPVDSPTAEYLDGLRRRDQALIAALFLTGGRVGEVIQLRRSNFELDDPVHVIVRGMRVFKKWRKIGESKDPVTGKKKYRTEPIYATRGTFTILRDEPLVPTMVSWLGEVDDYLFPSPMKSRSYLSGVRAYQIVTNVGRRCGLDIWPHWFRSQRASQLVTQYHFTIHELADWFRWDKLDTARIYSKLDPKVFNDRYAEATKEKTMMERMKALEKALQDVGVNPEEVLNEHR